MAPKFTLPGKVNAIPEDYPAWRYIDAIVADEKRKNLDPGVHGQQVQAFILLQKVHSYIAEARRELGIILGTTLCLEHCCCLYKTPLITRLEAEYIISQNGYYSDLVGIAEQWLLDNHECAPTYPSELPAILGGKPTPMKDVPQVAREMRALANLRSPYLIASHSTAMERLTVGPWARTSYANDSAIAHVENWDLLEDTQPLTCAVSGVFTLPPEHCTRRLGLGETATTRAVANPDTLKQGYEELLKLYDRMPDKAAYGLLPTMIYASANPAGFAKHIKDGKVALGKLGISKGRFPFKLWEQSPAGVAPSTRIMFGG